MLTKFFIYFGKGIVIAIAAIPLLLFVVIGTLDDTTVIDEFISRFF